MPSIHTYETQAGARRYCVRYREGAKHRGKTFTRKRDAQAFQAEVIRRAQLGELYQSDGASVGEYLGGWLGRYELRVRPSSAARRRHALRALPDPLQERPLSAVTAAEVEDAVTVIAHRAPRQAELALASLKLALKDAVKRGLRFDRRILELDAPRSNGRPARFLTWEEVQRIAQWLPDRHARLVMVAALSGLRRGEVMALKWEDVDLEAGTLRVREGKTAAARRSVDLPDTAVELLREQARSLTEGGSSAADVDGAKSPAGPRGHHESVGERQGWQPPSVSAPVFPNNRGDHMDGHNFLNRWFLPATRAVGLDGVTFHSLRHSFISMMAASGAHPSLIAAQVGHSDGGALVLKRYRHLFPQEGKAAAARFDAYLKALEASL